ncbi:MAG: hypothetical protein IKI55_00435 [Bacilli bacterium]|nr:hypothetical protein [Bacilli bacterium]
MKTKGKTRRIKMAAWAALMVPFAAIGANVTIRQVNNSEANVCSIERRLYGDSATRNPYPLTFYGAQICDYYEQPEFVLDYYTNLTEHFPTNNANNCGYVAISMLLSYYDTYWNRDIIPDQYNNPDQTVIDSHYDRDYSSPGVNDFYAPVVIDKDAVKPEDDAKDEEKEKYKEILRQAYRPYIDYMLSQPRVDDNLVSLLYFIARGNNRKKDIIWNFYERPEPRLFGDEVLALMNYYLEHVHLSDKIQAHVVDLMSFPTASETKEKRILLRQAAIEKLMEGQPIIYMGDLYGEKPVYDKDGNFFKGDGHIALAYGYDKSADQIIGHMGLKGRNGCSKAGFDGEFGKFDAFIYLDISPELEFTFDNPRFQYHNHDVNAHELSSHVHAHNRAMVEYGDDQYHALQCVCRDVKYEEHTFTVNRYDSLFHTRVCPCGFEKNETHNFRLSGMMLYKCTSCGFSMPAGQFPEPIYNP